MKKSQIAALLMALLLMATSAFAEAADPIVIKAGSIEIPLSEVQAMFDKGYEAEASLAAEYGTSVDETKLLGMRDSLINQLVQKAVMDGKVAEYGLGEVTDAQKEEIHKELTTSLEESIKAYADQLGISYEDAKAEYDAAGLTFDAQYALAIEDLPYSRLYDKIVADMTVADEEIMAAYNAYVEEQRADFENDVGSYELYRNTFGTEMLYTPEGYRQVKWIMLEIPESISAELSDLTGELGALRDEMDAKAQELFALENPQEGQAAPTGSIDAINAELEEMQVRSDALEQNLSEVRAKAVPELAGVMQEINNKLAAGESFDALIEQYSKDPERDLNPDGYQVHEQSIRYNEPIRAAAMGLANKGDLSAPVLDERGVFIIQYVDDVKGGAVEITEATKSELRQRILSDNKEKVFAETIAVWIADAKVEINADLIVLPEAQAIEPGVPEEGEETVG